jgi:hypothetical protein
VRPGKTSTYSDRIMATIPNPICASLIHPGDLVSDKVMFKKLHRIMLINFRNQVQLYRNILK